MVAMMATLLLAATGLGVDTAHVVYDNTRVQHSADAAALAIAADCAQKLPTCNKLGATGTADDFADENSGGDTGSITAGSLAPADGTVTADVAKRVTTNFFNAFGIDHKNVDAQATATWDNYPISGPVLPFAVSLCQYGKVPIDTPTLLRTDVNDVIADHIVTNNNTPLTTAHSNMVPYLEPPCPVPGDVTLNGNPSTVSMLPGGLWMSKGGSSTNNGFLIPTEILETLVSVDGWNVNQQNKFIKYIAPGKTMLFAIYAPTSNYDHGGLMANGTDAVWKGTVDMKIIGYAPFVISGWCLSSGSCGGVPPASVGFAGKFISTVHKDPEFEYDTGGANFGAYNVKLTE